MHGRPSPWYGATVGPDVVPKEQIIVGGGKLLPCPAVVLGKMATETLADLRAAWLTAEAELTAADEAAAKRKTLYRYMTPRELWDYGVADVRLLQRNYSK